MPKIPGVNHRDAVRALEKAGFRIVRQGKHVVMTDGVRILTEQDGWILVVTRGSHRQFKHPTKPGRVTVSGNLGDDMPKGTFASVRRQAGLKRGKT